MDVVPLNPAERVYELRSLETGARVVMVAQPLKLSSRERWSFELGKVVAVRHTEAKDLARIRRECPGQRLALTSTPEVSEAQNEAQQPFSTRASSTN